MSGAENFIRWYANKIATTDLVDARNKLFSIRAKNPKMYEFLVTEFTGKLPKTKQVHSDVDENDQNDVAYQFVKNPKPVKSSTGMVSRMQFDSSVPRRTRMASSSNIPRDVVVTTNMAASVNIPETKMYSAMAYGPNIPIQDDICNDDDCDDLKYLEELAKERRLNKQIYTKMALRRNIPPNHTSPTETMTLMAKESNIPSLNKNRLRFLKGESFEK